MESLRDSQGTERGRGDHGQDPGAWNRDRAGNGGRAGHQRLGKRGKEGAGLQRPERPGSCVSRLPPGLRLLVRPSPCTSALLHWIQAHLPQDTPLVSSAHGILSSEVGSFPTLPFWTHRSSGPGRSVLQGDASLLTGIGSFSRAESPFLPCFCLPSTTRWGLSERLGWGLSRGLTKASDSREPGHRYGTRRGGDRTGNRQHGSEQRAKAPSPQKRLIIHVPNQLARRRQDA